jgi:hypothetical protein
MKAADEVLRDAIARIQGDRCDGDSDYAAGVNAAVHRHVEMLRALAQEVEGSSGGTATALEPRDDHNRVQLSGGGAVTAGHRELKPNGQQMDYVVLSPEERDKGFVRPVRRTYTHKTCGTDTTMSQDIAETYARNPGFYSATFCTHCVEHLPLAEFVWKGTDERVGS